MLRTCARELGLQLGSMHAVGLACTLCIGACHLCIAASTGVARVRPGFGNRWRLSDL